MNRQYCQEVLQRALELAKIDKRSKHDTPIHLVELILSVDVAALISKFPTCLEPEKLVLRELGLYSGPILFYIQPIDEEEEL